jgi:hypothetical protein
METVAQTRLTNKEEIALFPSLDPKPPGPNAPRIPLAQTPILMDQYLYSPHLRDAKNPPIIDLRQLDADGTLSKYVPRPEPLKEWNPKKRPHRPRKKGGPRPHPFFTRTEGGRYESMKDFARANPNLIPGSTEYLKRRFAAQFRMNPNCSGYATPHVKVDKPLLQRLNIHPAEYHTFITACIILCVADPQLHASYFNTPVLTVPRQEPGFIYLYHHNLQEPFYNLLWDFIEQLGLQDFAVGVRSAIAFALRWPGWRDGVLPSGTSSLSSPLRTYAIIFAANLTPKHPHRIPLNIREEISTKGIREILNGTAA